MENILLAHSAFRWSNRSLLPICHVAEVSKRDLLSIDRQLNAAEKNIGNFINGKPFLNMLLWGERGNGKSSLVKLLLSLYKEKALKAVEFSPKNISEIYDLFLIVRKYSEMYFMVYFDDISFDEDDTVYRNFKSVLEGGLEDAPKNVIYVATSNRRHIIADKVYDTSDIYSRDNDNERASLQARFGLSLGFYPLNRDDYLKIVRKYLNDFSIEVTDTLERDAENFAIDRGGRTGRVAKQFAVHKSIF